MITWLSDTIGTCNWHCAFLDAQLARAFSTCVRHVCFAHLHDGITWYADAHIYDVKWRVLRQLRAHSLRHARSPDTLRIINAVACDIVWCKRKTRYISGESNKNVFRKRTRASPSGNIHQNTLSPLPLYLAFLNCKLLYCNYSRL